MPNLGCKGGGALFAYRYVLENGLALESDYPYLNKLRDCKYEESTMKAATIKDFKVF